MRRAPCRSSPGFDNSDFVAVEVVVFINKLINLTVERGAFIFVERLVAVGLRPREGHGVSHFILSQFKSGILP